MCGHGCVARNLIASLEQHSGKLGKFSKLQVAFPHDIWQNSSFIFYCCLGTGPFIQTSNANGDSYVRRECMSSISGKMWCGGIHLSVTGFGMCHMSVVQAGAVMGL